MKIRFSVEYEEQDKKPSHAKIEQMAASLISEVEAQGGEASVEIVGEAEYSKITDEPISFSLTDTQRLQNIIMLALESCHRASGHVDDDEEQDELELRVLELIEAHELLKRKLGGST